MKKTIILFLLFYINTFAQTYVKVNIITTLLTVPYIGVETDISKKMTFQFDAIGTSWKSIKGKPLHFGIFIPEIRYHFNEKHNGFYLGTHLGMSVFNFQKWNYLNSDTYQKGFGFLIGGTIGYQIKINDKFVLDYFFGAGNSQGFYKGYNINTGERGDGAKNWNKSGEWIPYRGGVMISYKIN